MSEHVTITEDLCHVLRGSLRVNIQMTRGSPGLGELLILSSGQGRPLRWQARTQGVRARQRPLTAHVAEHVTEQVAQLLRACQGEQSRAELMSALGLVHQVHFRESHLVPALAASYLEMKIPDKPKSSHQKYRLTPAGHAFLKTFSFEQPMTSTKGQEQQGTLKLQQGKHDAGMVESQGLSSECK